MLKEKGEMTAIVIFIYSLCSLSYAFALFPPFSFLLQQTFPIFNY